jgi:hypothetical protein
MKSIEAILNLVSEIVKELRKSCTVDIVLPLEDIPFPVLPRPYLIATKLKAGGPKDNYDIIELYGLLSEDEKKETVELASLIRRDKKLKALLEPKKGDTETDDKNQLI